MRYSIIILALILPLTIMSQVRVISAPKSNETEVTFRYDSLLNYRSSAGFFIGQDLFVIPHKRQFISNIKDIQFWKFIPTNDTQITISEGKLKSEDVQGRTYHVLKEIPTKVVGAGYMCFLELLEKESGNTIYYNFTSSSKENFPFIVMGFKEKFEKDNVNKKFIFHGEILQDINTGETLNTVNQTTWIFKEITAMKDVMKPCYYLENESGIATVVEDMENFYLKSKIDSYTKDYGKKIVDAAFRGDVVKGMPGGLVRLAKGTPKHINRSSYGEQWVYGEYGDDCIYFENGVVVAWN